MPVAFTTGLPVAIAVAVRSLFSVNAGEFTTGAPVEMELAVKAYSSDTIPLSASGADASGLKPNISQPLQSLARQPQPDA